MKTVFTNRELPHIWAQQSQSEGRGSSTFFEGATIYSYGKHFPMATIEGNDVFFTLRRYSVSTAKHLSRTESAVSHKNIIWCYEVPVKFWGNDKPLKEQCHTSTHEKNIKQWKGNIETLFNELGNKRNRDTQGRINSINNNIEQLTRYCDYFGYKIKDKELLNLLAIANKPDFVEQARGAKAKQDAANERRMKSSKKAYDLYLDHWRVGDLAVAHLPAKTIELANYYQKNISLTRLRFDEYKDRIETSKGIQIPAEAAKRAYIALIGCMERSCKSLSIPILNYTITETGKDYIKAGCHTIPKEDVRYIAQLLNW